VKFADLTQRGSEWLRGAGPMNEIVISSRVRLARNVAGYPFLARCSDEQRKELAQMLQEALLASPLASEVLYVDVEGAPDIDRQLLVERQLISRQQAEGKGARGVAITGNETTAVMVNEEDHLRMQVLRSGLQLDDAYQEIDRIDDEVEKRVHFAFSSRYGYLTACPTNVGTGIRVSVMLHLPALKMTGEIEKVFQAARDMRLAIRGLYGEGTEAAGDFFQVSNQTTLGRTEREIIKDFREQVIPDIIQFESAARGALLENRPEAIDDKAFRSLGLLRTSRLISSAETMHLLSNIRLGVNLGRIRDVELKAVNELFLLTQPAHLQKLHGRPMDANERSRVRAEFIRKRLN
jgi:protein arginine kinase